MDLLVRNLQRFLENYGGIGLAWENLVVIGKKCVRLLFKLDSKGYVHVDDKRSFFFATLKRAHEPIRGWFVVDLDLASRCRGPKPAVHIQYGQSVDIFSGTVRNASVNVDLGR